MNTTALLIVDVQKALFEKSTPIYHANDLLQNICTLVEQAHRTQTPVFYTQHHNDSFLVEGSEGWTMHRRLHPSQDDTIIHKATGNAFEGTSLKQELESRGVKTVIVTGLVTQGCVKDTCLGAKNEGYRVILVDDAHSNYSRDAAALVAVWNRKLKDQSVDVRSTQEISFRRLE